MAQGDRVTAKSWLAGRASRKDYWIFVAAVVAFAVVLQLIRPGASSWTSGAMLIIQIRRFHDFGRSGWWAAGLQAALFALTLVLAASAGDVGAGIAVIIGLAATVVVGLIPGEKKTNRFGPAPGAPAVEEVFS